MNCKKCNTPLPEGTSFCPNCGEKVVNSEPIKTIEVPVSTSKKSSNVPLIIGLVVGGFVILTIIIIVVILIFSGLIYGKNTVKEKVNTIEINEPTKQTVPSTSNTVTPSTKTDENTTVIGNDDYGYLTLPGTWYKFYDVSGTKSGLQYTKDSVWIVSIDSMTKTDSITAENLAKTALYNMKYGAETVENATGATVKVGSYTSYQVYGYYKADNIWLVEWFFEPGDGKVHYISVEGNDYTSDYFKIPDTFKLKK